MIPSNVKNFIKGQTDADDLVNDFAGCLLGAKPNS